MAFKAVIIEDEKKSRDVLKTLINSSFPEMEIVAEAGDVKAGEDAIKNNQPDLVFLDIELTDGTGFDILEKVKDLEFSVIFTTAYDHYALKAIKYSAVDYLLKPIDQDELVAAISKFTNRKSPGKDIDNIKFLLENLRNQHKEIEKITLPTGSAYEIVKVSDIIRIEADTSYSVFYLVTGKKFMVTHSLKYYEELLPEKDFVRIHHHHLININHVVRVLKEDSGYAILSDGSKVEVSRRKKEDFFARLK